MGGIHLLLWALATDGLTGEGMGGLFFRGGRPGPFFFTVTSDFSFTSSFSSSASESSEKESAEFPDITAGQRLGRQYSNEKMSQCNFVKSVMKKNKVNYQGTVFIN